MPRRWKRTSYSQAQWRNRQGFAKGKKSAEKTSPDSTAWNRRKWKEYVFETDENRPCGWILNARKAEFSLRCVYEYYEEHESFDRRTGGRNLFLACFYIVQSFAITLEKESNANYKAKIQDWDKSKELNPATFSNYSSGLLELWADKAIQEVFSMRSQFQLGESIRYYMAEENIERIMQHDYHPNSVQVPFSFPILTPWLVWHFMGA